MKETIRKLIIWIMMLMFFVVQMPLVHAQEASIETIRVGYYEDGDYMSRNKQGEYVGYNIEYLQEIAKQSGYRFEIVDAGSWTAAYEMLINGEIDMLPAVYYNEQRNKEVLFSTQAMCSIYTTLNVRMNDERYDYEDFQAFQDMKIGIIKDSVDGESFLTFCDEHELRVQLHEYDETNDLLSALDDGTLDGIAITHLGKNSSYRSVAQFSPSPLYFTVNKGRADVMAEVNKAMNQIQLGNPRYGSDLYDKYLAASANQSPVFTKEERQFMESSQPIIVAYDPAFAPFSYQDQSGEMNGVMKDIFQFIDEHSGLQFQFEPHTQSEALTLLSEGRIDVIATSDGDYLWDSRYQMNSTLYYLRAPTSMITSQDGGTVKTMALPKGYQLSETIAAGYPDVEIQYYATTEECLQAVLQHHADAACLNTQVAGAYLNQSSYKNLQTITLGQYINEMNIGVSNTLDARLFSIINKCIQYLPAEQVDAALVAHVGVSNEITILDVIDHYIWQIVCIGALLLGVIILLISYNLRNALRSNRRIQNLLYQDELTGLYNMNGFARTWEEKQNQIKKHKYALLYGDINQFKFINDNFGFAIGNQVLQESGSIFQKELQNEEYCARLSADHFAILMKFETIDSVLARLQRYMDVLNEWRVQQTSIPYKIEFIFGIYLIQEDDQSDIHQKLDFANYARRFAKEHPGKLAVLYDEQMRNQALLYQELESGLDRAIQNNEFVVYYQPKVSMQDRKVIGSEALIRWNHPERGFLMPGVFIPLFEKLGLVKQVDLWLFEDVCKTIRFWQQQGFELLPVSCNFSRLHFQNEGFPDQVCEIADRWGIPHELLELEITESAILEGSTDFEEMFIVLKQHGFRIAIDDFGSGYSALGQLQHLSADVLKLDRSFVYHGVSGKREQIVVGNIIHMSKELGMSVVCEGIETLEQAEVIQKIGCLIAQGFYYYKPITRDAFEQLIRKETQQTGE